VCLILVCRALIEVNSPDLKCLEHSLGSILGALIQYFKVPDKCLLSHDKYQTLICSLMERQRLFKKQVSLGTKEVQAQSYKFADFFNFFHYFLFIEYCVCG